MFYLRYFIVSGPIFEGLYMRYNYRFLVPYLFEYTLGIWGRTPYLYLKDQALKQS